MILLFILFAAWIHSAIYAENSRINFDTASTETIQAALKNIHVLQLDLFPTFGGGTMYKINVYELLRANNCPVSMFFGGDNISAEELKRRHLPFYPSSIQGSSLSNRENDDTSESENVVAKQVEQICRKEKIQIIHCHSPLELRIAKKVAAKLPIKIITTIHMDGKLNRFSLKDTYGVIGVNPTITNALIKNNKTNNLGIKKIVCIAPFANEQRFLNHQASLPRSEFFKKTYNIDIKNIPIIVNVGNFYRCKNQASIIRAVADLILIKKRPVELILAGLGIERDNCFRLAHELGIQEYVHFVGNTNQVPDLLFHTDIKVMASVMDAFPISIIEAACMKKPVIGTYGTGMIYMIEHEQSGLLFDPNSPNMLVECIERFLDDSSFAQECATNLYLHWKRNFSSDACLRKLVALYCDALN